MTRRSYSQFCALARTLDLVGERWTLLIVRDLGLAPKRFTDLLNGLPGIGTNLLSDRLRHLEAEGIVQRIAADQPGGGTLYRLTDRGRDLLWALIPLARWGASLLGSREAGDAFRGEWIAMMLLGSFRPDTAEGVHDCYVFRVEGESVWVTIDDRSIKAGQGNPPHPPDLVITTDVHTLVAIGTRALGPAEALAADPAMVVQGDADTALRALRLLGFADRPSRADEPRLTAEPTQRPGGQA